MKKFICLFVLSIVFTSCSEGEDPNPHDPVTGISTTVYIEEQLSTGEIIETREASLHWLFSADGKQMTVNSFRDLLDGYAYDELSKTSFKYQILEQDNLGHSFFEVSPEDYFLVVMISDTEDGRYSYTSLTIEEGEYLTYKKVFDNCCPRFSYEEWGVSH